MSKEYTRKQDAARAAKKEFGDNWADMVEIFPRDGKFVYDFPLRGEAQAEAVITHAREQAHSAVDSALNKPVRELLAETSREIKRKEAKAKELKGKKPIHTPATSPEASAPTPDEAQKPEDGDEGSAKAMAGADAQANAALVNVDALKPRISTAEKPTKLVWAVADQMPGKKRSEVIAECVKRGIAYGTARTQYQHWYKTKNDSAAAPKAKHENGKIIPPAK